MQKKYPLVSIYDAHSDKEIFGDPEIISRANVLALALSKAQLGAVGRVGSQVVTTILTTLAASGGTSVGLSPASTEREHKAAFRLPHVSFQLIYMGRGALAADVMALSSGHAVLISGSDTESLQGILGCVGDRGIPVAIYTTEPEQDVRTKVHQRYPHLAIHLTVSKDATKLVQHLFSEMRKMHLDNS